MSRHTPSYWRARFMWAAGLQIPVDLMAQLDAEGYDLTHLQQRYAQ